MADIRNLLNQIAAQESQLGNTQFFAPCVRGGSVRASVAGMVYTFTPKPQDFEGWGIFQPENSKTAELVEEANLPQVAEYLRLLKPVRLRLAYVLEGQTWLAYPVNESDMQQRIGIAKPFPVYLVTEGDPFEPAIARFDGRAWWFDELDRRADPIVAQQLREHLRQLTPLETLRFAGMTPEMRTVYDLALQQTAVYQARIQRQQQQQERKKQLRENQKLKQKERRDRAQYLKIQNSDEKRLRNALQMGGGELEEFRDRGDFWQIEWTTTRGERHTSAIDKKHLTVISSGICLSGRDRDFDLQSLVGVIEARGYWDF
ncbi:hypothetical protein H6F77_23465 [Microcoleus sp. FACHB-831]|uniref:hypothetical protein n=1 Tax=Microcoleus sp. FACHB-831 TaxID=2692827 RepID=UPI001681D00D|nr:hypothetical protein [Microcoleus sp. FACHB-831]MBD1924004.1 hypothetical protein [Microcoleus sp. FACHB-831]